jgi:hypothetical protein
MAIGWNQVPRSCPKKSAAAQLGSGVSVRGGTTTTTPPPLRARTAVTASSCCRHWSIVSVRQGETMARS